MIKNMTEIYGQVERITLTNKEKAYYVKPRLERKT
jgi:hypothetical protein